MSRAFAWCLGLAGIVAAAAGYVVCTLPSVHIGLEPTPLDWQARALVIALAAGCGALVGLATQRSPYRDPLALVLRLGCAAIVAAAIADTTERWIATTHFVAVDCPVTRAAWNAFVGDFMSGVVFVLFAAIFTVAIDFVLMVVTAIGAALMPFALMIIGPALGASVGLALARVVLRLSRRREPT